MTPSVDTAPPPSAVAGADSVRLAPSRDVAPRCANCGAEASDRFCPRCGQETHDLHRSLRGILGEMLDALAGWDGKIPTTIWLLVRRPGALTAEFLAGRRARYLRPLRLYLTMSVLFFVSLSLVERDRAGDESATVVSPAGVISAGRARGGIQLDAEDEALLARHRNDRDGGAAGWLTRRFVGGVSRVKDMPKAEQQRVMREGFAARAPNMVFVLLPVFALLLRLLYRRAPVYYAEHFVFALHNHAFAYLAMTLAHLASAWLQPVGLDAAAAVPLLWMPAYFFVAMRRVYGGSRRRTLAKFVALAATYGAILFVATIVTVLISIFALA